MRTICAWCGKIISGGNEDNGHISHGMCEKCCQKERMKLAALKAVRAAETVQAVQ